MVSSWPNSLLIRPMVPACENEPLPSTLLIVTSLTSWDVEGHLQVSTVVTRVTCQLCQPAQVQAGRVCEHAFLSELDIGGAF